MRPKVKNIQVGIIFLMLLASCAPLNQEPYPISPEINSSPSYGYSPEDPVEIWGPTAQFREQKINNFLNGLRSENWERFEIIEKELIPNPSYKIPRIKLYNIYTNKIINQKKGEFLEVYTLRSSNERDTIYIYIATHKRARSFVPAGLNYASN